MLDTVLVVKRDGPKEETTVKIRKTVYDDLKNLLDRRNMEVKTTITKIVSNYVEKETLNERYRPFLSIIRVDGNSVIVKDFKINKSVTVTLSYADDRLDNIVLTCDNCEDKEQCAHVAFVAESDEIAEAHINLKKKRKS